MNCLMGIDLGSTSLKAIVYDLDGNMLASGSRPTRQSRPSAEHPDWIVWEPEHIWGDTAAAIREAVAGLDDPNCIQAVAVTGMGMDGLPIDADGNWLYPMISWHDGRTAPQHQWWLETITAQRTFAIGGNPVWPINSALRILWMQQNEPELYARTDKWLLIEDFLNFMLCGRRVTDFSMASCTMLFDQRTRDWSDELCTAAGIERRILCEPLPSGTVIGKVQPAAAEATDLPVGTTVVLGGHDHLCGALPVGAFEPGKVLNITGTWECVMTASPEPVLREELLAGGMTVQAHVARGRHAIWGGNVAAGMLEWYRAQYGDAAQLQADTEGGQPWDYLMAEAEAAPVGARNAMFLPHMSGSGCPVVDERSLGALVGLSHLTTRGDILRAIIEGLDYQTLDMMAALERGLDAQLDRLIAVGGATRNAFWMQNKADVTGRPVDVPAVEEASPLGAAILAGIGVGLYENEADAYRRVFEPGVTYQPDPKRADFYRRGYEVYRQLYPATKPISQQLGELSR